MIPIQNVYYMLSYAFQVLNEQGYKDIATEQFNNTAELMAAILAKPVTSLWCSPIYGMMGASDVKFYVNAWKIYGMYPGIIFLTTLAAVFLTACYTRKISSSDSVGIE